jgi:type IV secretory pathway ATPase VirB11/archaellum biosynthesis ATPase
MRKAINVMIAFLFAVVFVWEKSLMVAVKNIARRLGDDISESKPILDSRLPDGSRVAAVGIDLA